MSAYVPLRALRLFVGTLAISIAMIFSIGCDGGEKTAEITGKVTIGGKVPDNQSLVINFLAMNGQPIAATVYPDGTYRAIEVPVGEVRIGFSLLEESQSDLAKTDKPVGGAGEDPTKIDPKMALERERNRNAIQPRKTPKTILAPKYRDPMSSGLKTIVEPGKINTYDVDLQ